MKAAETAALDFIMVREGLKQGSGAQGRNRTTDTVIFSHVLYQLSYLCMTAWLRKERL